VGRNYRAHADELGHDVPTTPLLFWKPVGCLAQGDPPQCALPRWGLGATRIDYEGEVALILGRDLGPGSPVLPDDPWDAVSGIAAAVDVSDRDLQKREPQWVRAKGFADACALGAPIPRPADPTDVALRTWKNDQQVQEGHTGALIFPFRALLRYLHGFCRLWAGDVILTGTPAGVGPLTPGDVVRVEVGPAEAPARVELRCVEGPRVSEFGDA
jgi:2-keto-4-pentenoate hydratase/2-oxohepta-3-ene-1,7-dioic acid hydratase in catechol pathway